VLSTLTVTYAQGAAEAFEGCIPIHGPERQPHGDGVTGFPLLWARFKKKSLKNIEEIEAKKVMPIHAEHLEMFSGFNLISPALGKTVKVIS